LVFFWLLLIGQPVLAGDLTWGGPFAELRFGALSSEAELQSTSFGEYESHRWSGADRAIDLSLGYRFPVGKGGVYLAPVLRWSGADTTALVAGVLTPESLAVPVSTSLVYREPLALSISLQAAYAPSRQWLVYGEYGLVAQAATIQSWYEMGDFHDDETSSGFILGHVVTLGVAHRLSDQLYITGGVEWRSYQGRFSDDSLRLRLDRKDTELFAGVGVEF
jgi:hypothetical protein